LSNYLVVCEIGIIILDCDNKPILSKRHSGNPLYLTFRDITKGKLSQEINEILGMDEINGEKTLAVEENLSKFLKSDKLEIQPLSEEQSKYLWNNRVKFIVESKLSSEEEAIKIIRENSIYEAENKLRELSSGTDLQIIQAVQALDEIDKFANMLSSRLKEWYGLHFPELSNLINDNTVYAKFIVNIGSRVNINQDKLKENGIDSKKGKVIDKISKRSKGSDIGEEELTRIINLAKEHIKLIEESEQLTSYIEKSMKSSAPNINSLIGSTIGARLIMKAGGLNKLARLPSSTIQILGAERALFRAMKTGGKPPKHGIIFQHNTIHSSPRWQRGKIARLLAGKVAIASRIDAFRGSAEESLDEQFETRVKMIMEKNAEPPTSEKNENKNKKRRKHSHNKDRR